MLFLGTLKYPKQDHYREYLTKNGGSSNAFTSGAMTAYHFDIANKGFEEALDIFSEFFVSPLFNEDCTEREMKAVDNEYNLKLQDDNRRFYHMYL